MRYEPTLACASQVDGVARVAPVGPTKRILAGARVERARAVGLVHEQDAVDGRPARVAGVGDGERGRLTSRSVQQFSVLEERMTFVEKVKQAKAIRVTESLVSMSSSVKASIPALGWFSIA